MLIESNQRLSRLVYVVYQKMTWRLFLALLQTEELNVSLWKIGDDTGVDCDE